MSQGNRIFNMWWDPDDVFDGLDVFGALYTMKLYTHVSSPVYPQLVWQKTYTENSDYGDHDRTAPNITMIDGTLGYLYLWGGGITDDEHGHETFIDLNAWMPPFTSNQFNMIYEIPWQVSTPAHV